MNIFASIDANGWSIIIGAIVIGVLQIMNMWFQHHAKVLAVKNTARIEELAKETSETKSAVNGQMERFRLIQEAETRRAIEEFKVAYLKVAAFDALAKAPAPPVVITQPPAAPAEVIVVNPPSEPANVKTIKP